MEHPKKAKKQRIPYKDLNAFINTKVEQALNKRDKAKEKKKKSTVTNATAVNAFEHFHNLEVVDSDNDDRKPEAVKQRI